MEFRDRFAQVALVGSSHAAQPAHWSGIFTDNKALRLARGHEERPQQNLSGQVLMLGLLLPYDCVSILRGLRMTKSWFVINAYRHVEVPRAWVSLWEPIEFSGPAFIIRRPI